LTCFESGFGVSTTSARLLRERSDAAGPGAHVVAVASEAKRERILELGADHFVPRDSADLQASVEALAGEQSVDVVADVVGGQLFGPILKVLRRGGRYTTSGAIGGPTTAMDLRDLIYQDLEMYGITNPTADTCPPRRACRDESSQPMLEASYPLSELCAAQEQLLKRAHVGKLVVVP
jgi:NADPH:quinone reductase-like Zn-dependent oxidoreductase